MATNLFDLLSSFSIILPKSKPDFAKRLCLLEPEPTEIVAMLAKDCEKAVRTESFARALEKSMLCAVWPPPKKQERHDHVP